MGKTTDKTVNYKVGDMVMLILDTPKYVNYGCDKTDHKKIFKVSRLIGRDQYEVLKEGGCRKSTRYWVYSEMLKPLDKQLMFDFMYE